MLVWPLYLNDIYLIALNNSRLGLLWMLDILFFLLIPSATLFWLYRNRKISLQGIGLANRPTAVTIMAGVLLCAGLVILIQWNLRPFLNALLPWHLYAGYDFPHSQPLRSITILYAALTAGILEEIVYRGIVTTELQKHIHSKVMVVVLSCVIFAGIHWSEGPATLIYIGTWAIIPTIWFLKQKNLWGPITCHILYDLLIFTGMV